MKRFWKSVKIATRKARKAQTRKWQKNGEKVGILWTKERKRAFHYKTGYTIKNY